MGGISVTSYENILRWVLAFIMKFWVKFAFCDSNSTRHFVNRVLKMRKKLKFGFSGFQFFFVFWFFEVYFQEYFNRKKIEFVFFEFFWKCWTLEKLEPWKIIKNCLSVFMKFKFCFPTRTFFIKAFLFIRTSLSTTKLNLLK